jgi:hypothetical protein
MEVTPKGRLRQGSILLSPKLLTSKSGATCSLLSKTVITSWFSSLRLVESINEVWACSNFVAELHPYVSRGSGRNRRIACSSSLLKGITIFETRISLKTPQHR